ncbi:ABC transporter permease [Actinoplanes rectilineatus]|uniref:ABC transporter permease n=1 Tax=Actinoplanes rectilineatus TaxID=113571 RepID=UPI0005F2C734|nr:ABC transporter permease [Actinoplanes rectilineatus]
MVVDIPPPELARHPLRQLASDRWAVAGGATIVVFLLIALAAPLLSGLEGHDPYTYDLDAVSDTGAPLGFGGGISVEHWFGVEPMTGRDLFAIVVHGARTSFLVGFAATALAVLIGVAVGLTAGYLGGWYDRLVSRFIDVLFGFPWLVFVIALGAIAPADLPKQLLIILVIGLFGWPGIARVVRGQTLALKQRTFVVAATALGAGPGHLLRHQYLPNLTSTIIVYSTMTIPGMIGAEAALSFLGVGVPPPTPAWGRTIGDAVGWVQTDPMFLVFPGTALFLITLAFNLFGDGLRDALDPRTRGLKR